MTIIFVGMVCFFLGWKLGRKSQDFQDIMLARRIARLTDQREQVNKDRKDYDRWERQEQRYKKLMEADEEFELDEELLAR